MEARFGSRNASFEAMQLAGEKCEEVVAHLQLVSLRLAAKAVAATNEGEFAFPCCHEVDSSEESQ